MLVPNPLTQPNQSTVLPTRTQSQVTSEQIKQQSESPSQELRCSPRASQQPAVKTGNHSPTEATETQNQSKSRTELLSGAKKKLQWGDSKAQPKQLSQSCDWPGCCIVNKVKIKPEGEWNAVERKQSPCKREAPLSSPTAKTKHSRSRGPQQNVKKHEITSCNKLGGLAECSEEKLVDKLTTKHIANQCCICFASHRIDCEMETKSSSNTIACLAKLNKQSLHQFAQVFKAAGEKHPDILLHEEVQRDCNNLKEWLAAALKEIRRLEKKGVWTKCLKSKAEGEKIIPCAWVFCHKRNPAGEIIKCEVRICLRGDLMIDNAESCTPVVQWSTICFFIICSIHVG